jgi:hypothetical protein
MLTTGAVVKPAGTVAAFISTPVASLMLWTVAGPRAAAGSLAKVLPWDWKALLDVTPS